ncbi:DUF3324 domain-containing protein [Chryseobacterium sp. GCR10]|uniref:DUF3324 domain-containing protein n=1 Tax=Chryseobacterium caseinilyticum TaxID=2771428 RepID=A0ABR8ZFV6_9FLAO|nr:DUF3324 domain-containing protein [Chryseobacterium caseinilyticum]
MIKKFLLFLLFIIASQFVKAGIVVINGLTHSYQVDKGQVYKGTIEIENTSTNPQNVKLFLQDFSYQSDGSIFYTEPLTNKRTNSNWIKLNTNLITLKGKEKTEVRYEITVPNSIAGPGSYWSVIIVEPVDDITPSDNKPGVNITSIVRYAIQVITDYNTEKAKPELKFEGVKIEKQEKQKILKIAIANTGNLYCRPTANVEIYDRKNGQKVGSFSSQTMGLLPNTSKTFDIDISKILPNKYTAVLLATDEDENAFALNVELEVKND